MDHKLITANWVIFAPRRPLNNPLTQVPSFRRVGVALGMRAGKM